LEGLPECAEEMVAGSRWKLSPPGVDLERGQPVDRPVAKRAPSMGELVTQLLCRRRVDLVRGEEAVEQDVHGRDLARPESLAPAQCLDLVNLVVDPLASRALRLESASELAVAALVVPARCPTRAALDD